MQRRTGLTLAAAGAWTLPTLALTSNRIAHLLGMQTHLEDRQGFALTFDDGPHPEGTPAILDMLARLDVPATFFLTGEQVLRYPDVAREIAALGHTVGVHGHRHRLLTLRSPSASAADLQLARAAIHDTIKTMPRLYRPPYGAANPMVLLTARSIGLRPVLWARWGRDWEQRASAASVAASATRDLRGGEILLLHDADHYSAPDSWRATVAALPEIVHAVERAGLSFRALH